jgi:hypothetical protein
MRRPLCLPLAGLAAIAVLCSAATACADIFADFNQGNDAGFTHYDPLAPFGSGTTYTFPVLGPGNDGYRLTSNPSADPGNLGVARVGSLRLDQSFADFRISVDLVTWDPTLHQGFGVAARASQIGLGTSNAYYLFYNPGTGFAQAELDMNRIDGEQPSVVVGVNLNRLDPKAGYRLVFTGIGSTLTGQIFALSNLNNPLATVTLKDSTYKTGFTGILATGLIGDVNTPVDATFDNFGVQSVPEPTSMALFLIGLALPVAGAWARRRRATRFS